jgi:uncharacterized protein (DUF983 family)
MPDTPQTAIRWPSTGAVADAADAKPGVARAMLRGTLGACPNCGRGRLFSGWLRQQTVCTVCAAPLARYRADDAPPYFVIFLVAHLVIGAQVLLDSVMELSLWTEAAIFLPITLVLSLGLLRPVKGATVGLMLHLGMLSPAGSAAQEYRING